MTVQVVPPPPAARVARPVIAYASVTKSFGSAAAPVHALAEITTELRDGEFVSIVGPSGCGKSTLLRLTAGLLTPTSGTVTLGGRVVETTQTAIGVVFQYPVLLPWKKALDNVLFQIEMRGLRRADYVDRTRALMALVGLEGFEDRYPHELSGGMQHRVALCRALIHDPAILLMDEPFGALDALTRDQINVELAKIWESRRKTILFVTHSIPEAVFLSTRVLVMSRRPGRILDDIAIDLGERRANEIRDSARFVEYSRRIRALVG